MTNALFVDGAYLMKAAPDKFDYLKLIALLEERFGEVKDRYFFNSTPDPATDAQNAFHSWMKSAKPKGPHFRLKLYGLKQLSVRCDSCNAQFSRTVQKGVDVGLCTFIIKLAAQNKFTRAFVAAGDGDFDDALSYVRDELGKEIVIVGFEGSVSTDLQSLADQTFYLNEFIDKIKKV